MRRLIRYIHYSFLCLYAPLMSVLHHKELFWSLYKREFKSQTIGTSLGVFWLVGQQVLQVVTLWFLIDVILQVRFPGETPFLTYLLIGMIPWFFITEVLLRSTGLFKEFSELFKRSVFPLEILPILNISFSFSIFLVIYIFITLILNGWIAMLLSVIVFIMLFLWLIPFVYLFATFGVFIKDFVKLVPFLMTMIMYLSPILYMPSLIPEKYQFYLIFNPIADIMATIHAVIDKQQLPEIYTILRLFTIWLVSLAPAWLFFKRAEKHIRDIV